MPTTSRWTAMPSKSWSIQGQLDISPGTPGPNVAAFKTAPFNIDTTKPSVTSITLSPAGGIYAQNTSVMATVTCTDPSSATVPNFFSGIANCASQGFPGNQQKRHNNTNRFEHFGTGDADLHHKRGRCCGQRLCHLKRDLPGRRIGGYSTAMIGNLLVKTGTNMTYYIAVANHRAEHGNCGQPDRHFAHGNDVREFRIRDRVLQLRWQHASLFDYASNELLWQRGRILQPWQPCGLDEEESNGSLGSDHGERDCKSKFNHHQ